VSGQPESPQAGPKPPSVDDRPSRARSRRNLFAVIGIVFLALVILAMATAAWILANPGSWRAWTDDRGIYVRDGAPDVRPVIWEPARSIDAAINASPDIADGALSSRANLVVFTRKPPGAEHSDLYMARFDGQRWSPPEPIVFLNTNADEFSPTLSKSGRALLFASDRKGGMGGLDILRKLRESRPILPVVILTALGEEADRVEGLKLGGDVLAEPTDIDGHLVADLAQEFHGQVDPLRLDPADVGADFVQAVLQTD